MLVIDNQSECDVAELYLSPSTASGWGDDWLTSPILAGASRQITGIAPDTYDLLALADCNSHHWEKWEWELVSGTYTWILSDCECYEGEPEGEGPVCGLSAIELTTPMVGARIVVPEDASELPFTFTSETDCPEDTDLVTYSLDGLNIGAASDSPYPVTLENVTALARGEHELTATAFSLGFGEPVATRTIAFTLVEADAEADLDGNALPDDPFVTLPEDGDIWLSSAIDLDTGRLRLVEAVAFHPSVGADPLPVVAALDGELSGARHLVVSASPALLQSQHTGVLLVSWAPDQATLLGAEQAELLAPTPEGSIVPGGQYAEVSVIVTPDGGATFHEIDRTYIVAHPVHVLFAGLQLPEVLNVALYSHPTEVDSDPTTGIQILTTRGVWSTDNADALEVGEGRMEADFDDLSVIAPFVVAEYQPVIGVEPAEVLFGFVTIDTSRDKSVTVTNDGDGLLFGSASVQSPFSIVSGGEYQLRAGESQEVVIRFSPTHEVDYDAVVIFTGAEGAQTTVRGSGTEKLFTILGCGSGAPATGGGVGADILIVAVALAGLYLAAKKRALQR